MRRWSENEGEKALGRAERASSKLTSDERDLEVERGVRLELLVRVSIRNDDEHELRVTLNGSGRGSQRASTAADLGTDSPGPRCSKRSGTPSSATGADFLEQKLRWAAACWGSPSLDRTNKDRANQVSKWIGQRERDASADLFRGKR